MQKKNVPGVIFAISAIECHYCSVNRTRVASDLLKDLVCYEPNPRPQRDILTTVLSKVQVPFMTETERSEKKYVY